VPAIGTSVRPHLRRLGALSGGVWRLLIASDPIAGVMPRLCSMDPWTQDQVEDPSRRRKSRVERRRLVVTGSHPDRLFHPLLGQRPVAVRATRTVGEPKRPTTRTSRHARLHDRLLIDIQHPWRRPPRQLEVEAVVQSPGERRRVAVAVHETPPGHTREGQPSVDPLITRGACVGILRHALQSDTKCRPDRTQRPESALRRCNSLVPRV